MADDTDDPPEGTSPGEDVWASELEQITGIRPQVPPPAKRCKRPKKASTAVATIKSNTSTICKNPSKAAAKREKRKLEGNLLSVSRWYQKL